MELVDKLDREVGFPAPWDLDEFVDRLERHRGRPIDLIELDGPVGEITGMWLRREDRDVIGYPGNTTTHHQDVVVLHELAHMLFEHAGLCVFSDASRIAPSLHPEAFEHLLGRADGADDEFMAETVATLALTRIWQGDRQTRPEGELARRVTEAFG
ncbi:hypothetical protein BAY60_35470 (plasmid) [Prauserella muralis]|uniref:IrrE N-terminal-like domain-containing protein n=1 Tax=Prauserella muralis TaxID=588067 RepID=A0A2V4ABM1_9PSEU|nr:hypothetical protein BAY60_35470 [Prauserella muralis]